MLTQTTYVRGGVKPVEITTTTSYGKYTWTKKSPFKLTGYVSQKKYADKDSALKVGVFFMDIKGRCSKRGAII